MVSMRANLLFGLKPEFQIAPFGTPGLLPKLVGPVGEFVVVCSFNAHFLFRVLCVSAPPNVGGKSVLRARFSTPVPYRPVLNAPENPDFDGRRMKMTVRARRDIAATGLG